MEKNRSAGIINSEPVTLGLIFAYVYLYVPIFIFLLTWAKPWISYSLCLGILIYAVWKCRTWKWKEWKIPDKKAVLSYLLLAVLLLGWCVVSGQGAYVKQAGDWDKHHAVLQDLMQRRWPVTYTYHGMEGTLTYYIAGYLLPSLLGKLTGYLGFDGMRAAEGGVLLWTWLGLLLICSLGYQYIKGKNVVNYCLLA